MKAIATRLRSSRRWLPLLSLLLSPAQAQDYTVADLDQAFARDVLIISTADRGCFRFDIHVAVNREQQMRGLMFVRYLPEWSGMLFIYARAERHSMWMKNTYIPLDIVFAKADGTVSSVADNTEPLSLTSIGSVEAVTYVLELNAGTAQRLGINEHATLILDVPDAEL